MNNKKSQVLLTILMSIFTAFLILAWIYISREGNKKALEAEIVSKYLNDEGIDLDADSLKLIFIINFLDFNCALCLNDFLSISDKINKTNKFSNDQILYLVQRDFRELSLQERIVTRWKKNNLIRFDVKIVNNMLSELSEAKSGVLLSDNNIFRYYQFPFKNSKSNIWGKLDL